MISRSDIASLVSSIFAFWGTCEKNPDTVQGINCPVVLLKALKEYCPEAKIIHLSTDHVYDGDNAPYVEAANLNPVNLYGKSKRDFEAVLLEDFKQQSVILRSSVIYGESTGKKGGKST